MHEQLDLATLLLFQKYGAYILVSLSASYVAKRSLLYLHLQCGGTSMLLDSSGRAY